MRNPSGAEDMGREGIVVTEGMGNAVEVEPIAVRVGAVVGIVVTVPQAPTSNAMRVMENMINSRLGVFINVSIANSKSKYNRLFVR
jgi:hypothetical protein